mmetsp:Transcript_2071/g.3660  ORF Transcript_2071/g.3660 Transcript_2071/m.3660 type:complete len:185 (+) Transcript_2071:218-772(+)
MINLAFYDDLMVCYNGSLTLFWDSYTSLIFGLQGDIGESMKKALQMIHKSPVVYKDCSMLFNDVKFLDEIFTIFDQANSVNMYLHIFENLMFNTGDILFNLIEAKKDINNFDYNGLGLTSGRIIVDLFYSNPIDASVWTNAHSNIVIDETTSIKVSLIQESPFVKQSPATSFLDSLTKLAGQFD